MDFGRSTANRAFSASSIARACFLSMPARSAMAYNQLSTVTPRIEYRAGRSAKTHPEVDDHSAARRDDGRVFRSHRFPPT
jgi:hypothetical protein